MKQLIVTVSLVLIGVMIYGFLISNDDSAQKQMERIGDSMVDDLSTVEEDDSSGGSS